MLFKSSQAQPISAEMSGAIKDERRQKAMMCRADQALAEAIPEIERNSTVHYLTAGAWALHDLARHIISKIGPAHLMGFTWSITEPAVKQLVRMKNEGEILSMSMIIDIAMSKWSRDACEFARKNCIEFRTTPIHAKGFILKNNDWTISVISSANFSNNPRIEAGIITDDESIYNFHKEWTDKVIEKSDPFVSNQEELFPVEKTEYQKTILFYMKQPGDEPHPLSVSGNKTFIDIDSFFIRNDVYDYSKDGLELALEWARAECLNYASLQARTISISGVTEKTLPNFMSIAKKYGYKIKKLKESK